jgi:hypothetical protein
MHACCWLQASEAGDAEGGSAYARGVRRNALLGGDNCSRAVLLGALLAAEVIESPLSSCAANVGLPQHQLNARAPSLPRQGHAVPEEWASKTRVLSDGHVGAMVEGLVE